jgi:hypothetical protein
MSKSEAKKKIHVRPISATTEHNDPERIDVPGYVFSWQNEQLKNKVGWGTHLPVERDSELGEEVIKQFGVTGDQYAGLNSGTNRFYNGGELVLSYTSIKLYEQALAEKQERADAQLGIVEEDAGSLSRFSVVSPGLKR